jgi:nicotinamide-nucleotide adenylyltransferase
MRALVIGRFQPLHLGHLRMIEWVLERCDEITIGIGSPNKSGEPDNPYTFQQRSMMLEQSLNTEKKYSIIGIPDFGDRVKWIKWISENIDFDVFYTNSPNEKDIFAGAGYAVEYVPFFDREKYSASKIRERIKNKKEHKNLLPDGTAEALKETDEKQR